MRVVYSVTLLIALLFRVSVAYAEPKDVIFFGDSSSDNGYFGLNPAVIGLDDTIYVSGVDTLRPGLMWNESFGSKFGIDVQVVDGDISNATTNGGNSYAASDARITKENTNVTGAWTVENQIDRYLSDNGGKADADTIYSFNIVNDLKFYRELSSTGGVNYIRSDMVDWGSYGDYNDLIDDFAEQLLTIKNAGGQYFLIDKAIVGAPSQAMSDALGNMLPYDETAYENVSAYNAALLSSLQENGLNVIWFDAENVYSEVIDNYSAFGLTETGLTTSACTSDLLGGIGLWYEDGNEPDCAEDALTAYVFVDGDHLAPAMQEIQADAKYNLIVAPVQISYLPETLFKTREIVNDTIDEQIYTSFSRGNITNTWVTFDTELFNQDVDTTGYQDISNTGFRALVGYDYKFYQDFLAGISLAYGVSNSEYGDDRGEYTQTETTVSLYSAYNRAFSQIGSFRTNIILSYGLIDNEIERNVPIGITTQHLSGDTDGSNISLAVNSEFIMQRHLGSYLVNHGPSLRFLAQDVTIDAFDESNSDELDSIALGFNEQDVESRTLDLGYKFCFSKKSAWISNIVWTHRVEPHVVYELGDLERKVEARVISEVTEPTYYIMTPEKDRSYAGLLLATEIAYKENTKARLGVTSNLDEDGNYTYVATFNFGVNF